MELDPITREEVYLSAVAGDTPTDNVPMPETRIEFFLQEIINSVTAISELVSTLDVESVGGSGKYIAAISETDGKISAIAETMDTVPTASSTKAVTSGGIHTPLAAIIDGDAKNRLHFTSMITGQLAGCVYTVNADGSVSVDVSGKTGNSYCSLAIEGAAQEIDDFCNGNYVLSGCPSGGGSENSFRLYAAKGGYSAYDYGNGVILPNNGAQKGINVIIYIDAGYTGDNLTFKPMICRKTDWDVSHEFTSYCPTNIELYQMILNLQ